jgi:hypothetical protein
MNFKTNKVVEVTGSKDDEGALVGLNAQNRRSKNQRWKVIYKKDMAKDATKGLNKTFGF